MQVFLALSTLSIPTPGPGGFHPGFTLECPGGRAEPLGPSPPADQQRETPRDHRAERPHGDARRDGVAG